MEIIKQFLKDKKVAGEYEWGKITITISVITYSKLNGHLLFFLSPYFMAFSSKLSLLIMCDIITVSVQGWKYDHLV